MPACNLFNQPPDELVALLAACKEVPSEDAPRLVLADWIEEHARTAAERGWAEIIRLQCAHARRPTYDAPPSEESRRVRVLIRRSQRTWPGPLKDVPGHWTTQRGLLWLEAASWRPAGGSRRLAGGAWARVEGVKLSGLSPAVTERLARWGVLAEVASLELYGCRFGLRGPRALATSPYLERLSHLSLTYSDLNAKGVAALAASPRLANLTWLNLRSNNLTRRAVEDLAASPHLRRLRKLDLGNCKIGDAGLRALAASGLLATVESLDVEQNKVTTAGVEALLQSRHVGRLAELDLSRNTFDPEMLATSPALRRLEVLNLSCTGLSLPGFSALAGALPPSLRQLNLSWGPLGDAGARALASSPGLCSLRELDLIYCQVGSAGVAALARSPLPGHLRRLALTGNPLGDAGAAELATSNALAGLMRLELSYSGIGAEGAVALAESPHLGGLRALIATGNRFGTRGREALKSRFHKTAMLVM